jgi:hypothetical protein
MSSSNFEELSWHAGHDVEVVTYQRGGHVYNNAIECNDCGTVLMSFDNPNNGYKPAEQQKELQMEGVEQ